MSYWQQQRGIDSKGFRRPGGGGAAGSFRNPEAPALFPSAAAVAAGESESTNNDDGAVAEQLFPPGKIADLESRLRKSPDETYIGKKNNEH